ncbi:hypothetical protein ABZP36_009631 [Zizania latifolia]
MLGRGGEAPAHHPPSHLHKNDAHEDDAPLGVVKLISAEGFEFVVDKKAAMVSNTLRNMLTSPGGFSETREGEVRFPEITTSILEKICQYFYWSLHFSRVRIPLGTHLPRHGVGSRVAGKLTDEGVVPRELLQRPPWMGSGSQPAMGTASQGCLFADSFVLFELVVSSGKETAEFPIEPEITLELMMAANYLDT